MKLLRHYAQGFPRPYDADAGDDEALRGFGFIESVGGRHEESYAGGRAASPTPEGPEATDDGRTWLQWYTEQSRS